MFPVFLRTVGVALLLLPATFAQLPNPVSRPMPTSDDVEDVEQAMRAIEEWSGVFRVTFAHSGSNPDENQSKRNIRGSARVLATGNFRLYFRGDSGWDGKVVTTMEANTESSQEAWRPVLQDTGEGFFNLDPDPGPDTRPWRKFGTERESQSGSSMGEGFLTLEIRNGSYRIRSGAQCRTQFVRDDSFDEYGSKTPSGELARREYPQTSDIYFSVMGALPASGALYDGLSGSMECPVMVRTGQENELDAWLDSYTRISLWQELWRYQKTSDAPMARVEWRLRPAPRIQVRFKTGRGNWRRADQFFDFLVGKCQPPVDVKIITYPHDTAVQWKLEPVGEHSGTVTPNSGSDKEFSFSADMPKTPPRTPPPPDEKGGTKERNVPVGYRITVRALDDFGASARETIEQDVVSVLRQEYIDYGLKPPDRALVGDVPTVPSWLKIPKRSSVFGNYSDGSCDNVTLNGGWLDLVNKTYSHYGAKIEINSAYRNPQRNKAVNGVKTSIHQEAGAVDMDPVPENTPQSPEDLIKLYRSALPTLQSGAKNVFLEKEVKGINGGVVLLPRNWNPPPATHTFTLGDATVDVKDTDNDDLPDQVVSAQFTETRLNIYTLLPYPDSGELIQPPFIIIDYNNSKRIDAGDGLELVYMPHPNNQPNVEWFPPEEVPDAFGPPVPGDIRANARNRWRCRPLRWYFEQASHVHCDNGKRPVLLQGP